MTGEVLSAIRELQNHREIMRTDFSSEIWMQESLKDVF